jgi:Xaa-Pro aminopeptidase
MERIGTGVAVIRSARLRSIERDYPQDSDYREDNDLFYLTGLEAPGAWLVLVARPSAPDSAILYLPEREPGPEQWTGALLGPGPEATRRSGIADVRPASDVERDIERAVLGPASAARKGALYLKRGSRDSPPIRRLLHAGAGGARPAIRDLEDELAALRQIKDEDEIRRLRRAITITEEAILEAMAEARPGMYEYELEGRIEYGFRRRGAERVGFPSIVGSGPNGTTLHYDENRRQTRPGELVVMDVGAEHGYYSADITRTIPISGRFTPRQRQLYELVLGAQQAAIDAVRPGTDLAALNRIARDHMRRHSGQLCGGSSCDRYFVHGLCHWLGMDVHDVGVFSRPLEPGMVLTIEPGIYLPAESLGIRIEDDVLVTSRGAEVLSSGVPRAVEEVERAMAAPSR